MTRETTAEARQARVRAGLYRLLALTLLKPPDEEIVALWTDHVMREELRPFFSSACLDELALGVDGPETSPRSIKLAYDAIFSVPIKGKCVTPYESVYREEHVIDGNPMKLLMGDSAQAVQRFYLEVGLEPPLTARELPDHIGMELLAMAGMCEQQAEALENNQPDEAAAWITQQRRFLAEHLREWAGPLAGDIREKSPHHFIRAVADMMSELIGNDLKYLEGTQAGPELQNMGATA